MDSRAVHVLAGGESICNFCDLGIRESLVDDIRQTMIQDLCWERVYAAGEYFKA